MMHWGSEWVRSVKGITEGKGGAQVGGGLGGSEGGQTRQKEALCDSRKKSFEDSRFLDKRTYDVLVFEEGEIQRGRVIGNLLAEFNVGA